MTHPWVNANTTIAGTSLNFSIGNTCSFILNFPASHLSFLGGKSKNIPRDPERNRPLKHTRIQIYEEISKPWKGSWGSSRYVPGVCWSFLWITRHWNNHLKGQVVSVAEDLMLHMNSVPFGEKKQVFLYERHRFSCLASWWFQPTWNLLVKMGSSSPRFGVKIKKYFELPPPS